jgi:hypothetical protein
VQLEGSISLARVEAKLSGLPKGQEIVFYCA